MVSKAIECSIDLIFLSSLWGAGMGVRVGEGVPLRVGEGFSLGLDGSVAPGVCGGFSLGVVKACL